VSKRWPWARPGSDRTPSPGQRNGGVHYRGNTGINSPNCCRRAGCDRDRDLCDGLSIHANFRGQKHVRSGHIPRDGVAAIARDTLDGASIGSVAPRPRYGLGVRYRLVDSVYGVSQCTRRFRAVPEWLNGDGAHAIYKSIQYGAANVFGTLCATGPSAFSIIELVTPFYQRPRRSHSLSGLDSTDQRFSASHLIGLRAISPRNPNPA